LIHCANSGTTARLLMGLLSGQNFAAMLIGDQSLSSRPMARLADLLRQMGARIMTAENGRLPAMVEGGPLKGQEFTLPVRSAQMKSALLIAGMHAEGKTTLSNVALTRDHTERMLPAFGYPIDDGDDEISIEGEQHFEIEDEVTYKVPGDISSAAFVIAAAVLLRRDLKINNISLNASRTRFLEIITLMGVELEEENIISEYNEERGTLMVHGSRVEGLEPFQLSGDDVALLIDELPILSILAMYAHGESNFRDASELRVKESDRLKLLGEQLKAFGVNVQEHSDGLTIHGEPDRSIRQCKINHGGDHRLAMSFAIAALTAQEAIHIEEANIASVSYPEFFEHLAKLAGTSRIRVHPTHADT
jgi:3-phosphoshikimate 1-carboxyvinyltransferase